LEPGAADQSDLFDRTLLLAARFRRLDRENSALTIRNQNCQRRVTHLGGDQQKRLPGAQRQLQDGEGVVCVLYRRVSDKNQRLVDCGRLNGVVEQM